MPKLNGYYIAYCRDRFKTCVNMYGDCVGASIVNHWQKTQPVQDQKVTEDNQQSLIHEDDFNKEDRSTTV